MKKIDLTGQVFGYLVVLRESSKVRRGNIRWECRCRCGNITVVPGNGLKLGHTKSCGCLRLEVLAAGRASGTKHGMAGTLLYRVWHQIVSRCSNPANKAFVNYGGRGITVCDEWRHDFMAFHDHVTRLPNYGEKGYTIDRIDNDGNYEPGNVRWATRMEQRHNRRR